jgi:dihydrofolate reductase
MEFSIIAAADQNYGIGINNTLPWRIPAELKYFQEVTKGGTVIMGRNTWDSLPAKSKPLSDRQNIVITSNPNLELPTGVAIADSLDSALAMATNSSVFVIGGATLYASSILDSRCKKVYLTQILDKFECDTFFPAEEMGNKFVQDSVSEMQSDNGFNFEFQIFDRK